jgi:hypothetical protein
VRSFILFFSNLCFAGIMTQDSGKSIAENDTKLTDPKVFMEAMISEMRRVMKMEREPVHERIDQMENRREEQPQNGRNLRRRGRVPPREEDEERYGSGFDEEEDRESIVNNRRPRGRFGEARNREEDGFDPEVDLILRHILSGRKRWSSCLIATTTRRQRR